jgi:hypothetical protein
MARLATLMAKTDSFFIRASTATNGVTYAQSSIDLGAYVDALGKSVLRIHNIQVQFGSPGTEPTPTANEITSVVYQLTTQSQGSMVSMLNKSVIASGQLTIAGNATGNLLLLEQNQDIAPQHWTNGYLVGVEQIYLGVDQGADRIDEINIVLECTVETLSSSAAMALALSQQ